MKGTKKFTIITIEYTSPINGRLIHTTAELHFDKDYLKENTPYDMYRKSITNAYDKEKLDHGIVHGVLFYYVGDE